MHKRIQLTLTAEKYRSVTRNNCSTRTAKFMIEFIRRINLFKTLSDDRRTLANALVKVSETKLDMSKGFFTRGPTYRGNKNPMLVPKRACRHLRETEIEIQGKSVIASLSCCRLFSEYPEIWESRTQVLSHCWEVNLIFLPRLLQSTSQE